MPALSLQERQSLDAALDLVLRLLDCLQQVPPDKNTIDPGHVDWIRRTIGDLKDMVADGRLDFQPNGDAITAETDRHGIHLNPDFGGDYRNAYQLPGEYLLDDCREGYFNSLWYAVEILLHEIHHYRWHTGFGAFFKAFLWFIGKIATLATLLPGPGARRKYPANEHEAYLSAYLALLRLENMLILVCHHVPDCLPCCEQHLAAARAARTRQEPFE